MEIIDLSQEIYEGMPVYKSLPQVKISMSNSHEEWEGIEKNNPGHSLFIYWAGDYGKFWTISGRVVKVASA